MFLENPTLLDHLLEGPNWMVATFILSMIFGVCISIYLMQITESTPAVPGDSYWMRALRRASLACLAIAFLWCLSFGYTKGWEPWPPMIAVVLAIDLNLLMRTITTKLREQAVLRERERVSRLASIETSPRR